MPRRRLRASTSQRARKSTMFRNTGSLSLDYERMIVDDYRGIARINGAYVGPMHDVSYYHETLSPYALRDARAAADFNPLYVQPAADHWSSVPDEALKLAQQIINQWRTKPPEQTKQVVRSTGLAFLLPVAICCLTSD
jgi:hypothetical protein